MESGGWGVEIRETFSICFKLFPGCVNQTLLATCVFSADAGKNNAKQSVRQVTGRGKVVTAARCLPRS